MFSYDLTECFIQEVHTVLIFVANEEKLMLINFESLRIVS